MSKPIPTFQPQHDWQEIQESGQHREVAEILRNRKAKSKRVELPDFI